MIPCDILYATILFKKISPRGKGVTGLHHPLKVCGLQFGNPFRGLQLQALKFLFEEVFGRVMTTCPFYSQSLTTAKTQNYGAEN